MYSYFEDWSNRYKNFACTIENLKDLVELDKITVEEYETIVGEAYPKRTLDELKKEKIEFLNGYKHVKRSMFPYGTVGGIQRFEDSDILFINITIEGMKKGLVTSVEWKYEGDLYETVTDVKYFENMLIVGGAMLSVAFSVEKKVVNEIKLLDESHIGTYDEKARFDEQFQIEAEEYLKLIK